jgi:hypothetical protein
MPLISDSGKIHFGHYFPSTCDEYSEASAANKGVGQANNRGDGV